MGFASFYPSYELQIPGCRSLPVIASEAKQSMARQAERWIASLRSQ
jgi:hypothetical protein